MAASSTATATEPKTTTRRRAPQNKNLAELGTLLEGADKPATTTVVGGGVRSATGDNAVRSTSAAERMQKAAEQARAREEAAKAKAASSVASKAAAKADKSTASQPKASDKPKGTVDLGAYALTYHKPVLTGPDGVVHKCPHSTWGHEAERAAMACARKLASEAGLQI